MVFIAPSMHAGRQKDGCLPLGNDGSWNGSVESSLSILQVLRDTQERTKTCPQEKAVLTWANDATASDGEAEAWASLTPRLQPTLCNQEQAHVAHHDTLEQRMWERCQPSLQEGVEQQTLCQWGKRLLSERCVCIGVPTVLTRALCTPAGQSAHDRRGSQPHGTWTRPASVEPGSRRDSIRSPHISLSRLTTPLRLLLNNDS